MKALVAGSAGGTEVLSLITRPDPVPGPEDVLIRVKASALNRADVLQRRGHYPPPPGVTDVLGLECAGVVESAGPSVTRFKMGDRVMALMAGGGQAELAAVHESLVMPVPENLTFLQAAAIPEVFLTAYNALVLLGGFTAGSSALVHAGASGVGTAAIQIAKRLEGTIYVTVGSPEKAEACRQLGADGVVEYKHEDFPSKIADWTQGRGVDVLVDVVGAPYFPGNMASLGEDGRWIVLGFMGGPKVAALDLSKLLFKRILLQGATLRARPGPDKARLVSSFSAWALPLFADGRLVPVVDSFFPWDGAADAHRRMEENKNIGKIVLSVG